MAALYLTSLLPRKAVGVLVAGWLTILLRAETFIAAKERAGPRQQKLLPPYPVSEREGVECDLRMHVHACEMHMTCEILLWPTLA